MKVSQLVETCRFPDRQEEVIDVLFSSGGLRGFYLFGIAQYLHCLLKQNKLSIRRFGGASVGAVAAALMACRVDPDYVLNKAAEIYLECKNNNLGLVCFAKMLMNDAVPENGHDLCNGRLFITLRKAPCSIYDTFMKGLDPILVSEFSSREDLINTILCSCSAPFLILGGRETSVEWRGIRCLDGLTPIMFPYLPYNLNDIDGELPPVQTLYIDLIKLVPHYSIYHTVTPKDDSMLPLVVRGIKDAEKFFTAQMSNNISNIFVDSVSTMKWIQQANCSDIQKRLIPDYVSKIPAFLTFSGLWFLKKYAMASGIYFEAVQKNLYLRFISIFSA